MNTTNTKSPNKLNWFGLFLNLITLSIFLVLRNSEDGVGNFFSSSDSGAVIVNYVIAFIYFAAIVIYNYKENGLRLSKLNKSHYNYSLTLFCISAFTLNLSFNIFDDFAEWTWYYLLVMFIPLVTTPIHSRLPKVVRSLFFFIYGGGIIMAIYFSFYLIPLWPISMFGAFVLGISLHSFTPLLLLINYLREVLKTKRNGLDNAFLTMGLLIPLVIVVFFGIQWQRTYQQIHDAKATLITKNNHDLPTWVELSQQLSDDPMTEKIIQGDLLYAVKGHWRSWGMPSNSFAEHKKHDPLVFIGFMMMGDLGIDVKDRIKILQSKYDKRHLAHRKLWNGEDLKTSNVLTNIEVFPTYRMAYTEKIINIKNTHNYSWSQQEALYTFYLPEGSVATSMSLWIDGEERKSRLTTKEKADSAYVQIVGVESRDPALMHWQEGNRITVTVFPCMPGKERQFKVGITTPLTKNNNQLTLENIYFEGPHVRDARETTVVRFFENKTPEGLSLPEGFEAESPGKFLRTDNYENDWKLSFIAPELAKEYFSFNGKNYHVENLSYTNQQIDIDKIYLDVNRNWNSEDILNIVQSAKNKKVLVYSDGFFELTPENYELSCKKLLNQRFSCFPWYKIKQPEKVLVVTSPAATTPNLVDLSMSVYANKLTNYLKKLETGIKVFNLGEEESAYMKSLGEFGALEVNKGSVAELLNLLETNNFKTPNIDSNSVAVKCADLKIVKDTVQKVNSVAPDHLMRVHSYKQLLKIAGRSFYNQDKMELEEMVAVANEAYIVSPISSLIVLETQKDYERFGIDENKDSLGNAAVGNSGAVPEPHEWLLIGLLVIGVLIKVYYR